MFPADRQALQQPVTVEYDSRGQAGGSASRVRKTLPSAYEARRFYAAKLRAGKNPCHRGQAGPVAPRLAYLTTPPSSRLGARTGHPRHPGPSGPPWQASPVGDPLAGC